MKGIELASNKEVSSRILACFGLFLAIHCAIGSRVEGAQNGEPASLVGKPAPELSYRAYGSNIQVDLSDLRGKMVVVDFFRAENAKDYTGFDDVVEAEHDYGRKGVVIVGVCIDGTQAPMMNLLRKKPGVDWPIGFDGMGFAGPISLRWKASRQTGTLSYEAFWHIDYLVSPEGSVLWVGEPEQLSRAIEDQIKDHKPQVVDSSVMAEAKDAMDKTQAAITANNLGEAFHQRAQIPQAALADDDFAAEVKDTDDKLQAAGDAALAEVDPLIANKDYAAAVTKLKDISNGADGTPLGNKAKAKLIELQKDPEARAALATAEKNDHADEALKVAQKLQAEKKDLAAYGRFKFIVKNFADTPAAKTASDAVAAYDGDPEFKKKLAGAAPAEAASSSGAPAADAKPAPGRAKSLLSLANSYRDSGDTDKAREKYQAVIDQFPGTPEAQTAKDELAKLPQ